MSEREEYTPPMEVLHDIYCGIFEPINPDLKRSSEQFNRAIAAHDQEVAEQRCLKICWHIDRLVEHADQMTRSDLLVAINNLSATADSIARGGQEQ